MADRSKHTSMFPECYRLYSAPGPSHFLGSTILGQNLLRNPALFLHKNSFETPNIPSSSVVAPKKQLQPRKENPGLYSIIQLTSKVMTTLVGAPIGRVYILMQCQNEMLKYGHLSSPYKGMIDCFQRTIKHEGFISLWRGNSINFVNPLTMQGIKVIKLVLAVQNCLILFLILCSLVIQALSFAYIYLKRDKFQKPPFWVVPLGAITGVLFTFPLDYARVRLATDVKAGHGLQISLDFSGKRLCNACKNRMFSGVFDVFKKTLKSDGIVGLYRGYTLACFGVFSYYQENLPFAAKVAPAALLSLPMVFYPLTTITRRMMMTSGEATKYKGVIDAVSQIVRDEGASALYKGVTPFVIFSLSRNAISVAFLYFTYSGMHNLANRVSS